MKLMCQICHLLIELFCFFIDIEFYRFLHVQEQCQIKWQISIDKYNKLKMEHANCKSIRAEWEAKFQHVTELLLNEKQKRRNAEARRDFLVSFFSFFEFLSIY